MDRTFRFPYGKVAQRIFGLFVLCAFLPVTALTFISFRHVREQLEHDAGLQLRQAAKLAGMAMYERLEFLVDDMGNIAMGLRSASMDSNPFLLGGVGRDTSQLFRGVGLLSSNNELQVLFGTLEAVPEPTPLQLRHLKSGSTILLTYPCAAEMRCPRLLRYIDPKEPSLGLLIGDPQPGYLWGRDKLPPTTTVCVLDITGNTVACPGPAANELRAALGGLSGASGNLEWQDGKQTYLAGYWTMFLRATLHAPGWTLVLSESRNDLLAPLNKFRRAFLPLIALILVLVVLLSFIQIRRSMVPLQKLEKGTRQIAQGQFDTRMEVSSGDEFEQLAESFNRMARDLGRQFRVLETMRDIDQAILSSLDRRDIVNRVLRRVRALLPYDAISVTLLDHGQLDRGVTFVAADQQHLRIRVLGNTLEPGEVEELQAAPDAIHVDVTRRTRTYLEGVTQRGVKCCCVLPIRHENQLFGVLSLGSLSALESSEDLAYAKQVAARLAVGLSNARLVEELDKLNAGTFTALARAIDAKSTWTAGHSERVTQMAVEIGRVLGLPERELIILHRGGLLHDIGKIGTPPEILDKPEKLTKTEVQVMCEHVTTGGRILEPIPGFAELLPIVVQHHERFDGSGYPYGLSGEAIHPYARIFAVADVFDALISSRPYRPGWARERVIAYIRERAGTHFDPRVVAAFEQVMEKRAAASSAHSNAESSGSDGAAVPMQMS